MPWDRRTVVYGATDVSCDADHQFLNNTLRQSPCLVYAYMVGSCASVYVEVQALNQSSAYPAPSGDPSLGIQSASQCTCGRVPYNLISACATCQGKTVLPWSSYDTHCENFDGKYNFSSHVPAGSALPVWATRQTNATSFVWNVALGDKGAGEFSATNSSGVSSSLTGTATSGPTDLPYTAGGERAATIDNSAAVGLAATAVVLTLGLIAAFVHFWRRMKIATVATVHNDKGSLKGSIPTSTIAHSVLFSCVATLAIVNASLTTWTSAALVASHELGFDALRNLLNFLVFTSWWTLVGSSFFLIAFLYDRSNRAEDGSFTATRFASLHSHLIWLLITCALWLLGASLFAASVAQREECPVHCTQLRAIPVFAFLELVATALALGVVVYSYWTLRKRSKPPKRLGRQPSQTRRTRR